MSSKSKASRRKRYKDDLEKIDNSNLSISEKMKARSELDDQYYNSPYAKLQDQVNEMEDEHQYALIGVVSIVSAVIGAFFLNDPVAGFFAFGAIGLIVGVALLTEPGLQMMELLSENLGNDDNSQQSTVTTPKSSKPKRICQECGWQNAESNNFCHDCGSTMAE